MLVRSLCTTILALGLVAPVTADPIKDAAMSDARSAKDKARDEYRHPQQTLRFLGIEPDMTVVEIWPGGGWYTDILAPLLKDNGKLYAAHFHLDENTHPYFKKSRAAFEETMTSKPAYKNIQLTSFAPNKGTEIAPAGSADAVVTFRNVHNWLMRDGEEGVLDAFKQFHKALKKGGVLGVIEHRMPEDRDQIKDKDSGYVKQSYVVEMAVRAGFKLVDASEINANPLDTADHPRGVWTLPPRLALGEEKQAHYWAIGESDRMTLKFIKE